MLRSRTGDSFEVEVAGLATPVEVRRSARAARLTLRVNEARRGAVLTLPEGDPDATRWILWPTERAVLHNGTMV